MVKFYPYCKIYFCCYTFPVSSLCHVKVHVYFARLASLAQIGELARRLVHVFFFTHTSSIHVLVAYNSGYGNVFKETIRFEEEDDHETDYEQSLLFSWPLEQNARDTQMTTRVTEGARRFRARFSCLEASPLNAHERVHSPY